MSSSFTNFDNFKIMETTTFPKNSAILGFSREILAKIVSTYTHGTSSKSYMIRSSIVVWIKHLCSMWICTSSSKTEHR